ncbi:conserved hypothetical protein [Xanthomonas citri pv. fuscans]|nr:conserved hypothetical protein [Xanthomonas citri pv. fuscans]
MRPGCRALARSPSRDTLKVRPCQLRGRIHAAKGPATVSGQGPVESSVCQCRRQAMFAGYLNKRWEMAVGNAQALSRTPPSHHEPLL